MSSSALTIPRMAKRRQNLSDKFYELDRLIDTIANSIPIGYEEKQRILEAVTITERYEVLMAKSFYGKLTLQRSVMTLR